MSSVVLPVRETAPAGERVYRLIRAAILDLTFLPGSPLSEAVLVQQIGVSRTPIRQALQRLEQEQLVRIFPQRGTVVSPLDLQAFREAFFVRSSLETAVAREAALRAEASDCRSLRAEIRSQKAAVKGDDPHAFFRLNDVFHRRLMALAQVPNVWSVVETAKVHLDRVRAAHLTLTDPYPLGPVVDEHEAIVDALAARDPAAAESVMRSHIEKVMPRADLLRDRRPDLFEWPAGLSTPTRLRPVQRS